VEASLGIQARQGDVILLRTGQSRREDDGQYAGWDAEALPWLHEHAIAAIGTDGPTETMPSGYSAVPTPVHQIGLVAMGLWLLDNLALDALAETAARLGRWEFCFTAAPLRFVGGSGSLLNPIATF
jgi:kynurenine formamidase